jgi:small subunit ribosomal protein S3
LNGAEIARTEHLSVGKIPLHTLRANVDFARSTAFTTYGTIGIKVWIYKGDVFEQRSNAKALSNE